MNVYCIILTDNEGSAAVEVFKTFAGAKTHILEAIMSDDSYRPQRKQVQKWEEGKLPLSVSDDDGDIILQRVELQE